MLCLILLLALILRLIAINQSFWLDEAIQVLESTVPFEKVWQIPADFHPPLFHYLAYFWLKVSTIEWWARLLPVFLGVTTVWLLFVFAKELTTKSQAILASLFLATSPFHIYYSQEFRPYMLSCLLTTACCYSFWKLIKSKKRINWLFFLVNIAGFYCLYLFPLIFIAQLFVILLFYKEKLINWLTNIFLSFLFFLPWLPMFCQQLNVGKEWTVSYPLWRTSVAIPLFKSLPLVLTKFWIGNISFEPKIFYGILALLLFMLFSFLNFKAWKKGKEKSLTVFIFFGVPILTAFLISFFLPIIAPKRLLLSLPFFYFLLAIGVFSLSKKWQKLAIFIILAVNIFSLSKYYLEPRFQREQWRGAITWVENQARNKSLVLFEFPSPFGAWDYYQKGKVKAKAVFESGLEIDLAMPEIIRDKEQVFLFQYLQEMADPEQKVASWLKNNGFILQETVDFPGVGFIYEYTK